MLRFLHSSFCFMFKKHSYFFLIFSFISNLKEWDFEDFVIVDVGSMQKVFFIETFIQNIIVLYVRKKIFFWFCA